MLSATASRIFNWTANPRPNAIRRLAVRGRFAMPTEAAKSADCFGIPDAFRISSNQFFSQLAVNLGREKLQETAGSVGIAAVDTPEQALSQGFFADIWNASNNRIAGAIAPAAFDRSSRAIKSVSTIWVWKEWDKATPDK